MLIKYLIESQTFIWIKEKSDNSVARMKEKIPMKRVADVAMHTNPKVVDLSLDEARIKIKDLENKLVFSNIRIAQCEKEKCDLTAIIEKLYEKFINKPLDDMIGKLESNLLLLNEEIRNIEQSSYNENSCNLRSNDNITIGGLQLTESESQPEVTLGNQITLNANRVLNDDLIKLSSDCESIVHDQDSIKNEVNIDYASLIVQVEKSLKHEDCTNRIHNSISDSEDNRTIKPDLRSDEILTISVEDDTYENDTPSASRPMVPLVIDLSDSSSQSDSEDCLLLSDNSNSPKTLSINQQKGTPFSAARRKSSLSDDDIQWILPNANDDGDSNITICSTNDEQNDNTSESLLMSMPDGSDEKSTQVDEDSLLESDQHTKLNANPKSVTCSEIEQRNHFTDVQKLNPHKFEVSSSAMSTEVNLVKINDLNCVKCSSNQGIISSANDSRNVIVVELDESDDLNDFKRSSNRQIISELDNFSSTQLYETIEEVPSENSNRSTFLETNQQRKSSLKVRNEDLNENKDSLDESITTGNSPRNDDSNNARQNVLDFLKRTPNPKRAIKEELGMDQETNAQKRAKIGRRASCSSLSSLLSPSHEIRGNKLPTWPCPICDEYFTNTVSYSRHLNQNHVGDKGVYTCSICHFVSPTISAYKRHIIKHHGDAFLFENRIHYEHYIYQDHDYAKTDFSFL